MDYADFLLNKKVIFVGPSSILQGKSFGHFIDSFDVVVKTNGAGFLEKRLFNDYGKRVDVLYMNRQFIDDNHPLDIREMKKRGIKHLCFKNKRKKMLDYYCPYFGVRGIRHVVNKLHKLKIDGLLYENAVITDLLLFKPKQLFVTGIDCYINKPYIFKDKYFKEYVSGYFTEKNKIQYAINNFGKIDNHDKYTNTNYLYCLYENGKFKTHDFIVDIMKEILNNKEKYSLEEFKKKVKK